MSLITRLTSMGIDYDAILGNIVPNMHKSMFDKTSWESIELTCDGLPDYMTINRSSILRIHNGQHEMLREAVTVGVAHISLAAPEDAVTMSIFKNGDQLIVYTPITVDNFILNIDQCERVLANISDSLNKDLISLIFYLAAEDSNSVFMTLGRIDTTVLNTVAENTKTMRRVVRPGRIKPWAL